MRTLVCLLVLVALLAVPAVAQTYVYVPDSNPATGGGNNWPLNFSSATGRFMQILNAKHLSTIVGPYKIKEIAFSKEATYYPDSFMAKEFQMRMSHSTLTNFSDTAFANWGAPCPTELISTKLGFTYTVPTEHVWADIGTVLDFAWDGKRNLCLEIRYRGNVTSLGFSCHSDSTMPRIWANSSTADNYVATTGSARTNSGLKVRLTIDTKNILLAPDTVSLGSAAGIVLTGMPSGVPYQIAASLGQSPLMIGKCKVGLTLDNVFIASVLYGGTIFANYGGITSKSGTATAKFTPPKIPALIGICVHHAGIAYDKTGVLGCTNTGGTQIK